jgi:hypothetical protein
VLNRNKTLNHIIEKLLYFHNEVNKKKTIVI